MFVYLMNGPVFVWNFCFYRFWDSFYHSSFSFLFPFPLDFPVLFDFLLVFPFFPLLPFECFAFWRFPFPFDFLLFLSFPFFWRLPFSPFGAFLGSAALTSLFFITPM